MNILISGFKPFGPHTENPTQKIIEQLPKTLGGVVIDTVLLPVEYGRAFDVLDEALKKGAYETVVMLGLAAGRKAINLEHHAINLRHATIPDEAGILKQFSPILDGGPILYESTLPYQHLIETASKEGFALTLSTDAGGYVCNDVFYLMRHHYPTVTSGFVHVPDEKTVPLDEQVSIIQWLIQHLKR